MLKVTGAMCLTLGLVAGLVLVVSPFEVLPFARPSLSAWVLFPMGFAAGAVLLALAAPGIALGELWRFCSAALLALASVSALGLMLPLLGILQPAHATLSLWYVLIVAGGVGTACALAPRASLSAS
jgi:hypothetical protein